MKISTRLSTDAWLLLASYSLNTIFNLFMMTFFISFIMHNAVNEIVSVSLYNIFYYAVSTIFLFLVVTGWVKRKNNVTILRLSALPKILCLLVIIFLSDSVVHYVALMGVMFGVIDTMFWAPTQILTAEKVPPTVMTKFMGYRSTLGGITKIAAPFLLGLFITLGSFEEVAKALLAFAFLEFILPLFMRPHRPAAGKGPDFRGFLRCMINTPGLRRWLRVEVLSGMALEGIVGVIITMYTVYMFKTDFMLGLLTTIFSLVAVIAMFLFGRFGSRAMFPKLLVSATIVTVGGFGLFVIDQSLTSFLIFNFVAVTATALLGKITVINGYNMSQSGCVAGESRAEYFAFRAAAHGIGSSISFGGLLLIGVFGGYEWLRWYLLPLALVIILICRRLVKYNPQFQ